MNLRNLVVSTLLLATVALSHALEIKPYTAAALAQAQKANKPVAIHFHADWCPTCRAQEQVLNKFKTEPGLDVTVLVANYDTEKDLKKRFSVRSQSTFIMLRGEQERYRLVGDTAPEAIRSALKSTL